MLQCGLRKKDYKHVGNGYKLLPIDKIVNIQILYKFNLVCLSLVNHLVWS
jgi:hypothetical protein